MQNHTHPQQIQQLTASVPTSIRHKHHTLKRANTIEARRYLISFLLLTLLLLYTGTQIQNHQAEQTSNTTIPAQTHQHL